jgi:hypothetical protein
MTTIRVYTAPGTNASQVADSYGVPWRDSVDRCDSDGGGRVFLDCDDDAVEHVVGLLHQDERVMDYEVLGEKE